MDILLSRVCSVPNPNHYKLHLACWNNREEPLDVFVRNRNEWDGWNSWRAKRDEFSRKFIFALIDFYPQKDRWLFGGAYRIISRRPFNGPNSYGIERVTEFEPFVGRLKVALKRPSRAKAVNLENHYAGLIVSEILPEPYTGESFPGYGKIDLSFSMPEKLISRQRSDWKTALENAKGIYLITDRRNGKRYVGAAYGVAGVWSRWECYVGTGHGDSDELTEIISQNGLDYARKNFRFALLEYCAMKTDDRAVIDRERYWKRVLMSHGQHGYNKN